MCFPPNNFLLWKGIALHLILYNYTRVILFALSARGHVFIGLGLSEYASGADTLGVLWNEEGLPTQG